MIVLDLFSGGKSLKSVCDELNYEYISLDIDASTNPDILTDILEWNYTEWNKQPDIIWASPECKWYSKLTSANKKYTSEDIQNGMDKSDLLILKIFEIIDYFKPKKYFIENPFTGRLKNRKIMEDRKYYRIDYCQYGFTYKKPTAIWTNINWTDARKCNPRTCPMVKIDYTRPNTSQNIGYYYNHINNLGGVKTELTMPNSTLGNRNQQLIRYSIPKQLLISLLTA